MFQDVGGSIRGIAKFFGYLGLIGGIGVWFIFLFMAQVGLAFIVLGSGITLFLSSFALYGFGQLVDDMHAIAQSNQQETMQESEESDELPDL